MVRAKSILQFAVGENGPAAPSRQFARI